MNRFFRNILVFSLLTIALASCKAQKFTTHAVKKGETLTGLSKQYRVDTATILRYNKEIKQGDELKANTILVIPRGEKTPTATRPSTSDQSKDSVIQGDEPIGFTSHRVRKRETLYGIAQRFRITEDEIKKYNPELYSAQLNKGMTLKIPQYRRTKAEQAAGSDEDLETYTVAPKETRWSIANKFGITIDSMLVLNPELSKATDYLAVGQELKMPRPAGSTVENQKTQLYLSYTVPPKMNFYQLEQKFGVKSDEIVRLNPEITEKGGLKENMVIRIPQVTLDAGEVNTDNYNFYEVKPKQTVFSLTRKLGLTYKDLLELNPDLSDGLKAGMVLKLPKDQKGDFDVRNALVLDKINLLDSIDVKNVPKVVFMFPFRIDKLDLANKEEVTDIIEDRNSLKFSLGLYSGALIALDSIADLGISVDVDSYDNQLSLARTKEILQKENLNTVSAIIGPLDLASLKETAVRAKGSQVPVIAPIPAESDLSLSNVFYSYTPNTVLRARMLDFAEEKYEGQNVVVIADSIHVVARDSILSRFPDAKVAEVIEEEKNIGIDIEKFKMLLSDELENWVFVETDNFKLVASVSSILNSFQNTLLDIEQPEREKLKLRMFTTNKTSAFENDVISSTHLSNLSFTYPSVYRIPESSAFSRRYEKRFGSLPDRYAVRGFDITYDLLLKLAYKNNLMEVSKYIGETEYAGTKFDYEKDPVKGYFNQASYIMTFEDLRIKQVQ
ncbi:amino acid/amide ABC transporter substrate-binding protein, HAAT family [Pricia antarctica]|uniref:Amino acid/amide ABC transporter substrate-binding protein, HAAT family n=1 Tax=Pricia antarctica TaxID=641691 RepID=A0A1G7DGW5_9FLAO|nr:LysM peptidoglycan-binding domain-containing protein [Pricia antarctica]SDE50055.1 amino acid/amide ABC transporter substrate-binding protein, HAAT family [Pricia antarctica]